MRHLELFSGTHSFGKVSHEMGFEVISLDRDLGAECPLGSGYKSKNHIKEDIMTWDYKKYPRGYFDLITASPVCAWWSCIKYSHIGRYYTRDKIEADIDNFGKPMVDKVFEILDYFDPKYYVIENPDTGRMKEYIPDWIPYYIVFYCMYGKPYRKRTRFWTNIEGFVPLKCCHKKHEITIARHKNAMGKSSKCSTLEAYTIPDELIKELFKNMKL